MKTPYIILKNVCYDSIDIKYKFLTTYKDKNKDMVAKKTKLSDTQETYNFTFVNEAKNNILLTFTMRDLLNNKKLPLHTHIMCWWCRHQFNTVPLGCPLNYKFNKVSKSYFSEITKSNYILKEPITNSEMNFLSQSFSEKNDDNAYIIDKENLDYFLTEGVFCSFPCVKAYIIENKTKNPKYDLSEMLLNLIYIKIFNVPPDIIPAHDWKLLKAYGGNLSIEQYRGELQKNIYLHSDGDYISTIPSLNPISSIYEKQIKI